MILLLPLAVSLMVLLLLLSKVFICMTNYFFYIAPMAADYLAQEEARCMYLFNCYENILSCTKSLLKPLRIHEMLLATMNQ